MKRKSARYYAEYLTEAGPGWWVIDRTIPDPPDDTSLRIAMCRNKALAFKIRDALNAMEDRHETI